MDNKEFPQVKLGRANILLIIELLMTICLAVISHFLLKEPVMAGIVLMVGIMITFSTYTIKTHIIDENRKQTEEGKQYWKAFSTWVEVQQHEDPDIKKVGTDIVQKAQQAVEQLWHNKTWRVNTSFELDTLIRKYSKETKHCIQATALCARKWQEKQTFKELFEENLKSLSKDVKVERIFILMDNEVKDSKVKEIIKQHKDAGIQVQCVKFEDIPGEKAKDFIIFDEKKVIWENLTADLKDFSDGYVSKDPHTLQDWIQTFNGISHRATPNINEFFR